MNIKNLTKAAVLTALALVIFVVENQIPPLVPVPGIKLGLSNVVTLFALWTLGRREAGAILLLRIILGSLICATVSAMLYSLAGGLLCYLVSCALKPLFSRKQVWVMGVLGAVAHNIGQLAVAIAITLTPALAAYFPVLMIAAVITGAFTGLCAQLAIGRLYKADTWLR